MLRLDQQCSELIYLSPKVHDFLNELDRTSVGKETFDARKQIWHYSKKKLINEIVLAIVDFNFNFPLPLPTLLLALLPWIPALRF